MRKRFFVELFLIVLSMNHHQTAADPIEQRSLQNSPVHSMPSSKLEAPSNAGTAYDEIAKALIGQAGPAFQDRRSSHNAFELWNKDSVYTGPRSYSRLNALNNVALGPKSRQDWDSLRNGELKDLSEQTKRVFYPFGGPDIIYPLLIYPNAKEIILVGLENPGHIPSSPEKADPSALYGALRDLLMDSYFHTIRMKKENNSSNSNAAKILASLKLMEANIENVQIDPNEKTPLKIYFKMKDDPEDAPPRVVKYYQSNLGNEQYGRFSALSETTPLWRDIERSDAPVTSTLFKASSLLPAQSNFSKLRQLVYKNSDSVLGTFSSILPQQYELESQDEWKMTVHPPGIKSRTSEKVFERPFALTALHFGGGAGSNLRETDSSTWKNFVQWAKYKAKAQEKGSPFHLQFGYPAVSDQKHLFVVRKQKR